MGEKEQGRAQAEVAGSIRLDAVSLAQSLHDDGREVRELRVPCRTFGHALERHEDLQ